MTQVDGRRGAQYCPSRGSGGRALLLGLGGVAGLGGTRLGSLALVARAARELGIARTTLASRLDVLGLRARRDAGESGEG